MKKITYISTILISLIISLCGCREEIIEMTPMGSLKIELIKDYKYQKHNIRGCFDAFYATVIVDYGNNDTEEFNCHFVDVEDKGTYTTDLSEGDKITVKKDMEFSIIINAEIDGYYVSGQSKPLIFSEEGLNAAIRIILKANQARVATYTPKEEDIYGTCVVAYGEIVETIEDSPLRSAGIACISESVYRTLSEDSQFSLENELIECNVEYYDNIYLGEENGGGPFKYSVTITGLSPATTYRMRAFAMVESWDSPEEANRTIYGKTISFTTTNDSTASIIVNTGEATTVSAEYATIPAHIIINNNSYSIDSINVVGVVAKDYDSYRANSTLSTGSNTNRAEEHPTETDTELYLSNLIPATTYVYKCYIILPNGQTIYGNTKMLYTTADLSDFQLTVDQINGNITTSSITIYGNLVNNANQEVVETGIAYEFSTGYEYTEAYDYWSKSASNSTLLGRFNAQVSMPEAVTTMYYAAYATIDIKGNRTTIFSPVKHASVVPAAAPASPQLSSSVSATNITTHSASIMSSLEYTDGHTTECGVLYSEWSDLSYDYSYKQVAGNYTGSRASSFTANIQNLSAGTTYYYCTYAHNDYETVLGEIRQFTTLNIGQTGPAGGIIFYVGNNWALESPYDTQTLTDITTAIWGSTDGLAITSESTSGLSNTEAIVNYHNGIGFANEYAAQQCSEYTMGGYSDFYLGTSTEMQYFVNYFSGQFPNTTSYTFWTSDEESAGTAYTVDENGNTGTAQKSIEYFVAPIRKF